MDTEYIDIFMFRDKQSDKYISRPDFSRFFPIVLLPFLQQGTMRRKLERAAGAAQLSKRPPAVGLLGASTPPRKAREDELELRLSGLEPHHTKGIWPCRRKSRQGRGGRILLISIGAMNAKKGGDCEAHVRKRRAVCAGSHDRRIQSALGPPTR